MIIVSTLPPCILQCCLNLYIHDIYIRFTMICVIFVGYDYE